MTNPHIVRIDKNHRMYLGKKTPPGTYILTTTNDGTLTLTPIHPPESETMTINPEKLDQLNTQVLDHLYSTKLHTRDELDYYLLSGNQEYHYLYSHAVKETAHKNDLPEKELFKQLEPYRAQERERVAKQRYAGWSDISQEHGARITVVRD